MNALDGQIVPGQKTLFQLSFPLFLHSFLTLAVLLIDTMIISTHSAASAAAVSIANQVLLVAYEFSTLLGVAGTILIAHSLGRGEDARAREIAGVTVMANAALGLVVGVVMAALGPLVLIWLNTPATVADDARLYIYVVSSAMVFNGFVVAAISCLRGFGRSRTVLFMGLFASTFYLVAEYVLILGFGPIPPLGVFGSALGTLLMRVVAAVILAAVFVRALGVNLHLGRAFASWGLVRRLFNLSFPSVSDNIAYSFYQLVLLGFVAVFGVVSVLSRAYVMIATAFLILVIMAISQGNEVLLGYQRGAGRSGDAYNQALRSAFLATAAATMLAWILYLISDVFIGLFSADPAVLALSGELLFLTIFLQPGFAINTILFQSLRAVGDARWPALVSQSVTWGLSLPLAWYLCVQLEHGVPGIWYALIIEESVKAMLMYYRWQGRGWLRNVIA